MLNKITLKLTFLILLTSSIFHQPYSIATIRYVSHTGSSTPPYTTWQTAADSIQKCINYSVDGDTIIVDNGIYFEKLKISKVLTLWGLNMDSTIVDSRGIVGSDTATIVTHAPTEIKNFHIIGDGKEIIYSWFDSDWLIITDCRIENGSGGIIFFGDGVNNKAENLIIRDVSVGIFTGDLFNTASYETRNNLIITEAHYGYGIVHSGGGAHEITNNIILYTNPEVVSESGISVDWGGRMIIKNNIVAGFEIWHYHQDQQQLDTAFIINNIFGYSSSTNPQGPPVVQISDGRKVFKNNIITRAKALTGILNYNFILNPDYNLYWDLLQSYEGLINPGENEIGADPMFVKDTIPNNELNFDYHLQKYSPAIDAGDPGILDVDGSRSDIGAYGGPGGEAYTYQDLAPRPPKNLTAELDSNTVTLKWLSNTEADLFHYRVYRDTVANFIIQPSKIIAEIDDTTFIEIISLEKNLYYKVTAVDTQQNQSPPSEEVAIIVTDIKEPKLIANDYMLYQNYPNPFNPVTKISYRLKERGLVQLKVYDIKGELVQILVNGGQEAGYYEIEFNGKANDPFPGTKLNEFASGIYLYRIEVIGEGKIPRFSDMKKMIFVK